MKRMNYALAVALLTCAWHALWAALPQDDVRQTRTVSGVFPSARADKVVLENENLDDWEVASAFTSGKTMSKGIAYPSMAVRTGGVYEVQLFRRDDYFKGLKLQFRQSGSDVVCRAAYARFSELKMQLGVDMDYFHRGSADIASTATGADYGIDSITFRKRTGVATTAYSADTPLEGPFVVNAPVVINPTATFGDAGRLPAEVQLSDTFDFRAAGGSTTLLTNRFSGFGGAVSFTCASDGAYLEATNSFGSWGDSPTQIFAGKTLVLPGMRLSDIVTFEDVRVNGSLATNFHFRAAGEHRMTVQMQRESSSYIYCAFVELTENADGVSAQQTHHYFCWKSHGGVLGMDLEAKHESVEGNYFLQAVTIVTRVPRANVTLSGLTVSYGCAFNVGTNVEVLVQSPTALPTGGVVTVENGGVLRIQTNVEVNVRYCIKKGGVLIDDTKKSICNRHMHMDIEGGTLVMNKGCGEENSLTDDGVTYINSLTVSDGGVIEGTFKPRTGNTYDGGYQSPRWRFTGSSPAYLKSGLLFVGCTRMTFYMEVDDVTGDEGVDLYQTGELREFMSDYAGYTTSSHYGHIRKTGAGTWKLDVVCVNLFGDIYLDAGTLLLARNEMLPKLAKYYYTDSGAIKFNGGTLACMENVTNTLHGVQLLKDSTIHVAAGGRFNIDSCASVAWTSGAKLSIECDEAKSVRFGTSADALTKRQQRALRLNGQPCKLDGNGYLVCVGLVLFVR